MAAAFSVASAYIYTEVGDFLDGAGAFEQVATHGVVGGALEVAQGGEFHTGFIAGAAGKAASVYSRPGTELGNALGGGTSPARVAFVATVGGTSSVLTGGKFGNGAVTAAFGHLFNELNSQNPFQAQKMWNDVQHATVNAFQSFLDKAGDFYASLVPGFNASKCAISECSNAELTVAAVSIIPVGTIFWKLGTIVANPALKITGLSGHAVNQAITRGVSPQALLATIKSPVVVLQQSSGRYLYVSNQAAAVLTPAGKLVTTYPASKFDNAIKNIIGK